MPRVCGCQCRLTRDWAVALRVRAVKNKTRNVSLSTTTCRQQHPLRVRVEVRVAAQYHHARPVAQQRQQQACEQEVREVVHLEAHLKPAFAQE